MARTETISNEQIIQAAREIFIREGFNASAASIARAAGVSEGSIFKRFATKEALFREALGLPDIDLGSELADLMADGPLKEGLERVALRLVEVFRELLPRMMMLWANHARSGLSPVDLLRGGEGQPLPLQLLRALSAQFEEQQKRGRLREFDPEILARVLIGATKQFVFFEIVNVHHRQPLAATSFARGVVDLVFEGAAPRTSDPQPAKDKSL